MIAALVVTTLSVDVVVLAELERMPPPPQALDHRVRRSMPVTVPEQVAPLGQLREPHILVVAKRTLPDDVVERIGRRKGVSAVEKADAAQLRLGGGQVATMGVNPSTFRAFTPKPTAASDGLWRNVAQGEAAVSFGLGTEGGLRLGSSVRAGGTEIRVGALATMGMGAIDAVVSRRTARRLGLPEDNALLVSAPKAELDALRRTILGDLPKDAQVVVLKPSFERPAAEVPDASLPADRIRVALTAAGSKLGAPYVWGAEGPDAFDCSGLIQWAFARAGVRLPRVTHQQFASGPQVPFAQMRPGDLIFWRLDPTNPGYISHAAIYWGEGKMIQAPRTGDVVKIVPVHARNLAGVVRVNTTG